MIMAADAVYSKRFTADPQKGGTE